MALALIPPDFVHDAWIALLSENDELINLCYCSVGIKSLLNYYQQNNLFFNEITQRLVHKYINVNKRDQITNNYLEGNLFQFNNDQGN